MTLDIQNCAIGKPQPWPRPAASKSQRIGASAETSEAAVWIDHWEAVNYIMAVAAIPKEAAEEALIEGITERLVKAKGMATPEKSGSLLRCIGLSARPPVSQPDVVAVWPSPVTEAQPIAEPNIEDLLRQADVALEQLFAIYGGAREMERQNIAAIGRCMVEALANCEASRKTGEKAA